MDRIIIADLEVCFRVGVTDEERAEPQRLLLSLDLELDLSRAAESDALEDTINYFSVCQRLLKLGETTCWRLIEKLAGDICALALQEYGARRVTVTVKKFIIPQTRHVAVQLTRGNE